MNGKASHQIEEFVGEGRAWIKQASVKRTVTMNEGTVLSMSCG